VDLTSKKYVLLPDLTDFENISSISFFVVIIGVMIILTNIAIVGLLITLI
jgi:hypothetical protein